MAKTVYCDKCAEIIYELPRGVSYDPPLRISGPKWNGEYCSLRCAVLVLKEQIKRDKQAGRT